MRVNQTNHQTLRNKEKKLTNDQFATLCSIKHNPKTAGQIARIQERLQESISRDIKKLEEQKYISVKKSKTSKVIRITNLGKEYIKTSTTFGNYALALQEMIEKLADQNLTPREDYS